MDRGQPFSTKDLGFALEIKHRMWLLDWRSSIFVKAGSGALTKKSLLRHRSILRSRVLTQLSHHVAGCSAFWVTSPMLRASTIKSNWMIVGFIVQIFSLYFSRFRVFLQKLELQSFWWSFRFFVLESIRFLSETRWVWIWDPGIDWIGWVIISGVGLDTSL